MNVAMEAKSDSVSSRVGRWRWPTAAAVGLHAFVWWIGPALFVTSLHPDTLQIVFWGRQWQLGYPKHPPLASWLLGAIVRPGFAPIFVILTLAAACIVITAGFVWAAARLYAPPRVAATAVAFYLASPAATFFAVQVNHNSLLIPFWAATLYFALRFFKTRRTSDALLLGLCAGLGAITKYEMFFLLAALLALAIAEPLYRPLFRRGAAWLAGLVFLAVCAPHLFWLVRHTNQSLTYALDSRPIEGWSDLLESLNNALIGHLILALGPTLGYLVLRASGFHPRVSRANRRLGLYVLFGPSVVLILASLAFHQIIRQGWTLPFAPGIALGAALCLDLEQRAPPRRWVTLLTGLAVARLALYFGLLLTSARAGRPIAAYDLDSRAMARQVEAFWSARSKAPLRCLIIDDTFVSSAPVLWLSSKLHVVQLDMPAWSGPRRLRSCLTQGAVTILHSPDRAPPTLRLCPGAQQIRAISPLSDGRAGWNVTLSFAPPADNLSACGAP